MNKEFDYLDDLQNVDDLTTDQKIQLARLRLDFEQLNLNKEKSRIEQKIFNKHFAVFIGAIFSIITVIFGYTQYWSTNIQKDKEIAISKTQKDKELELDQIKGERDLNTSNIQLQEQQKAEMLKLVSNFKDVLISGDKSKIEAIETLLHRTYPSVNIDGIFSSIELRTDSQNGQRLITFKRTIAIPRMRSKRINKDSFYPDAGGIVSADEDFYYENVNNKPNASAK